ncbi:Kazn [Vulpes lagopus]
MGKLRQQGVSAPRRKGASILSMMEDNKQLALRIDGAVQAASQEVTNLRAELTATNRRLAELSGGGGGPGPGPGAAAAADMESQQLGAQAAGDELVPAVPSRPAVGRGRAGEATTPECRPRGGPLFGFIPRASSAFLSPTDHLCWRPSPEPSRVWGAAGPEQSVIGARREE